MGAPQTTGRPSTGHVRFLPVALCGVLGSLRPCKLWCFFICTCASLGLDGEKVCVSLFSTEFEDCTSELCTYRENSSTKKARQKSNPTSKANFETVLLLPRCAVL